jgi:hypothetical protein
MFSPAVGSMLGLCRAAFARFVAGVGGEDAGSGHERFITEGHRISPARLWHSVPGANRI